MKTVMNNTRDAFWVIETLPDRPLFADCPVKPPEEVIDAAEELYLKLADKPTYISVNDAQIIFEWHYYRSNGVKKELYYSKELVFKDQINLEWKTFNYERQ